VSANSWWSEKYPARYYAYANMAQLRDGHPVVGWVDVSEFSAPPAWLPDAADMIAQTDAQWAERNSGNQIIVSGSVQTYTPPNVPVPLKTQATTAQAWIQQQANLASAMGEVFTADMKAYVKAIAAIASGTDTTSTALPAQPTDVMVGS
jgi:hypothetical protein